MVASAQQAAAATIKDSELLTLHDEARDVFVNAILHPPAPNALARKAAQRYTRNVWFANWQTKQACRGL